MTKINLTEPQRNRIFRQFTNDQYCITVMYVFYVFLSHTVQCLWSLLVTFSLCVCWVLSAVYVVFHAWSSIHTLLVFFIIQSKLYISNSDISNSAKLEASIWIKNTFLLLSPTITCGRGFVYKSKLICTSGNFELVKNSPINFEISRFDCI